MKKVTKEYNVYKFEELDKEVQESILNTFMEEEYQFYLDYELLSDMKDMAEELIQRHFKNARFDEVYYDLSYSQGSGAMIEFNTYLEDLNDKYKILDGEELNECIDIGYTLVSVEHNNPHYCHEYSFDIDYNDYTDYDNFDVIQPKIDKMIEMFKEDIVNMNKELSRIGYSYLENRPYFEERARERVNDYEYLEDGGIFNE